MKSSLPALLFLLAFASSISGSPIPHLFSTGVGDDKAALSSGIDPHYRLLLTEDNTRSTEAIVTMVGGWVPSDQQSAWIAPATTAPLDQTLGIFRFATGFDLTGLNPSTARIQGMFWADDYLVEIFLNGNALGIHGIGPDYVRTGNYYDVIPFVITNHFQPGTNRLEFLVFNLASGLGGLRVFMEGEACPPDDAPPWIDRHPESKEVVLGKEAMFLVEVSCGEPRYQWRKNEINLDQETNAVFLISSARLSDEGDYDVLVTLPNGKSTASQKVRLKVVNPEARLEISRENPGELRIHGTVGKTYKVEFTDFLPPEGIWDFLQYAAITENPQVIMDADAPFLEKRFYRAVFAE